MKAIILAAGYGTRLYPLTVDTPKPLLDIGGKPLIEHILIRVAEIPGVDEIVIVTNDKFYDVFMEWQEAYNSKISIKVLNDGTSSNEDRLGAIGDIDFAVKNENIDDDVLVVAGDNLFDFSLVHLHDFFRKKKASVVALNDLKEKEKAAKKFGVAEIDNDQRIVGFEEKPEFPKSSLASTACYFFTKSDLEELEKCIRERRKPDNLGDFIKYLSSKKHVYGYIFTEKWFDIGSYEHLREADSHLRK